MPAELPGLRIPGAGGKPGNPSRLKSTAVRFAILLQSSLPPAPPPAAGGGQSAVVYGASCPAGALPGSAPPQGRVKDRRERRKDTKSPPQTAGTRPARMEAVGAAVGPWELGHPCPQALRPSLEASQAGHSSHTPPPPPPPPAAPLPSPAQDRVTGIHVEALQVPGGLSRAQQGRCNLARGGHHACDLAPHCLRVASCLLQAGHRR